MVEESYGTCTSCGKDAILGDGLCVRCWDGVTRDEESVTYETHEQVRVLRSDTQELVQAISELLSCLNERQGKIVVSRFGLGSRGIHTLAKLGIEFNLTRERIRQIEAKALRKLRWQVYQGTHRKLMTYLKDNELFTPRGMLLRAVAGAGRVKTMEGN